MDAKTSWIEVFKLKESAKVRSLESYFPTGVATSGPTKLPPSGNLNPKSQPQGPSQGFDTKQWFWASKTPNTQPNPVNQPAPPPKPIEGVVAQPTPDDEINQLIVDNPDMSAATLINTLKSKGFIFTKDLPQTEADAASANVAVTRAGAKDGASPVEKKHSAKWDRCVDDVSKKGGAVDPHAVCTSQLGAGSYEAKKKSPHGNYHADPGIQHKPPKPLTKESNRKLMEFNAKIKETSINDGVGPTRFEVILLEEGLGNLRDSYYYTRDAIESGVTLFEGKKMYADHPDAIEEQTRPERSVRDIAAHYEKCRVQEDKDGRCLLVADAVVMPDQSYDWVRGLMRRAAALGSQFPDKQFIGLSINANGAAEEMPVDDFLKSYDVPMSALPKIKNAMESGLNVIRPVHKLTDAVSCDLVTEPGAGGRVLKVLE